MAAQQPLCSPPLHALLTAPLALPLQHTCCHDRGWITTRCFNCSNVVNRHSSKQACCCRPCRGCGDAGIVTECFRQLTASLTTGRPSRAVYKRAKTLLHRLTRTADAFYYRVLHHVRIQYWKQVPSKVAPAK